MTAALPEAARTALTAMAPIGRAVHPDEVAHAVRFLVSEEGGRDHRGGPGRRRRRGDVNAIPNHGGELMNQVKDKVIAALAEMSGRPTDEVTPETMISSLGLDSLDFVELTLIIEGDLNIRLDPEDFGELVTVQDAIEAIEATATLPA